MPESECRRCGERLAALTDGALKQLEMQHHAASEENVILRLFSGAEIKTKKHMCVAFRVYDEGGVHQIGVRLYAHGKYSAENSNL